MLCCFRESYGYGRPGASARNPMGPAAAPSRARYEKHNKEKEGDWLISVIEWGCFHSHKVFLGVLTVLQSSDINETMRFSPEA